MIVGIEGPVLAGKSSLIHVLIPLLADRGVSVEACPCFVEAATAMGLRLPEVVPPDPAAQLEAVRFYLEVDHARRRERSAAHGNERRGHVPLDAGPRPCLQPAMPPPITSSGFWNRRNDASTHELGPDGDPGLRAGPLR